MNLEEKDIPIIVEKGFYLAKDLLSPDSFYSLAVKQREGTYGTFEFNEKTGKVDFHTPSKIIRVNPDKITEQGVAICKTTDGDLFFKEGGRKGIAMEIRPDLCKGQGGYLGSLHTHPGGSPIPSPGDLGASTSNDDKIMCIATKMDTNKLGVNCYLPKTDWLPEEIYQKDIEIKGIMENMKEEIMNIKLSGIIAQIPVYDKQKIKWFSGAMLDVVRDNYNVREFRREI